MHNYPSVLVIKELIFNFNRSLHTVNINSKNNINCILLNIIINNDVFAEKYNDIDTNLNEESKQLLLENVYKFSEYLYKFIVFPL